MAAVFVVGGPLTVAGLVRVLVAEDEPPLSGPQAWATTASALPDTVHCVATVPPVDAPAPIVFGGHCGLDLVLLESRSPTGVAYELVVDALDEVPAGAAPLPAQVVPYRALEIHLDSPPTVPLQLARARIEFAIDAGWLDRWCPPGACSPVVLHDDGAGWTALEARAVRADGVAPIYSATTSTLSVFVIAGALAPTGPAGPLGLPVAAVALAGLGVAAVAALGVARWRTGVRAPATSASTTPAPPPAAGPPEIVGRLRDQDLIAFVSAASHDLSHPLTPIRLHLEILMQPGAGADLTEDQRRSLEVVQRNVEHLDLLVCDLKEAACLRAGKLRLEPAHVDLRELAASSVESFGEAAGRAGVRLELAQHRRPCIVDGDPRRLTQVLYNLVGNALKFTPAGGTVRVETHRRAGHATVRVKDTGLGLRGEDLARLFLPFSQLHGPTEKAKGTGLGLYICKGIVEAHGGRIWCESAGLGHGATFSVELPRPGASVQGTPEHARGRVTA